MFYMVFGLGIFTALHVYSMLLPVSRDGLKARLGEGTYKGLYSVAALIGLGVMIMGYRQLSAGPEAGELLYEPPGGMRHATMLLVLLAFISISSFHGRGYLKRWLRNPFSVGVALWAFGHLLSNGRAYAVLMFGAFLALALLDIALSTARGKRPLHEPQPRSDVIAAIAGMALYVVFLFGFHPYVLNLPVVR
jgi:uncharacterized membrane protein